jgi:nucleotide-binding universal stress UspA family protein
MKILVSVDGSRLSQQALEKLVEKFSVLRETPQLVVLNVHLEVPYKAAASWVGREAVEKYYSDESDAALAGAIAFLAARNVPFVAEKRIGDPAEQIAQCASEMQCDIIAMGTHGHGALGNLVMGSVATKVVALAKVPVLLMK